MCQGKRGGVLMMFTFKLKFNKKSHSPFVNDIAFILVLTFKAELTY